MKGGTKIKLVGEHNKVYYPFDPSTGTRNRGNVAGQIRGKNRSRWSDSERRFEVGEKELVTRAEQQI